MKKVRFCAGCGTQLLVRHKIKFCSNKCQINDRYNKYIAFWKEGKNDGSVGIKTRNISTHLRKYLKHKNGNKCSICGWGERHPITRIVSLEVDHIDGNSENNLESNLRLLCPNCHSLTPYYKNLNKGKGRRWRMDKYLKNSAYK